MKTLITIKCQMCGREFWARSITRKYCPECLQKRNEGHSKPKHVEKHVCPVCGKKFEPKVGNQVYCSHACAIAFHRKNVREKKREKRKKERGTEYIKHECVCCGKVFFNLNPRSVRCPECIKVGKKYDECGRFSKGISRQPCILCGRKGNTLQTQVCALCMDKLMRTWEKECSPGHRKCLVCGKEFVPNQVTYDMVSGTYHVTGQLTCSIRCTDILYGYSPETTKENTVGYKNGKVN